VRPSPRAVVAPFRRGHERCAFPAQGPDGAKAVHDHGHGHFLRLDPHQFFQPQGRVQRPLGRQASEATDQHEEAVGSEARALWKRFGKCIG
jgi:hypothetical protein